MSTKSRRAGTATPQPHPTGTSTPNIPINAPAAANRPTSPLSPTRHSRLVEKAELQNLNDRLAVYIDRVRNLETENARLSVEIQTSREHITRETTNLKSMYDGELSDARRLLDDTAREKAKLEIDTKRLWEENEELKAKLEKKAKECLLAEGNARMFESRSVDLAGKYNTAMTERNKVADELRDLLKEVEKLRRQLEETRKNLEEETLARVDLENNIQSLREELSFKDQVHSQEVNETRTRRQVEISEIDGRLSEQYEAKLQQSLQELREQYEAQMRANRDEIEFLFEHKIKNIEAANNRNSNAATNAVEELHIARTRIETLLKRLNELESINTSLNGRLREMEQLNDHDRNRYNAAVAKLEAELQQLRDNMTKQLQEYQDLMDIKVSLDLEIAAYDKLLCGEESRLNITPSTTNSASGTSFSQSLRSTRATPMRKTPSRGAASSAGLKRKRAIIDESDDFSHSEYFESSNAKGDVKIVEVNGEGKYVKLHNKGSKEVQLGGWQLLRFAGSNETNFKFHRSVKIDADATVTVWSSDVGAVHEPPTNIVMKTQKWFVGDKMKTVLINSDGDEEASAERIKKTVITHLSRHRTSTGGGLGLSTVDGGLNGEDLYHQEGDQSQGAERCGLM